MATSIQEILVTFHSRKLLLYFSFNQSSTPYPGSHHLPEPLERENYFDAKIVMVLSVLLCALIFSLGLNSIIRCAMRCSRSLNDGSRNANNSESGTLANTGIKQQALKTFPVVKYTSSLKLPSLDTECVICLANFSPGQNIRILPTCNHGFHVKCIDKWLKSHSSCPTCRHCLIETCQKIVGLAVAPLPLLANVALPGPPQEIIVTIAPLVSINASLPGPPQAIVVRIAPLEPEGMLHFQNILFNKSISKKCSCLSNH